MTGLGEVSCGPARHVMHQYLLLVTLLRLVTGRDTVHKPVVPDIPTMTTRGDFPFNIWEYEEERPSRAKQRRRPTQPTRVTSSTTTTTTQTPTTTLDTNYDYYFERNEDFDSDPSTWKLLPIQIPDDLVGNAILQEVKTTTAAPPTTQHRLPSVTQPPRTPQPERQHSAVTDHGGSVSQEQNWDHHSIEMEHRIPKPQNWDRHDTGNSHSNLIPQQNWDSLDSETVHSNPVPHQHWDGNDNSDSHSNTAQHDNWDRHDSASSHSIPEPQLWDRHSSKSGHMNTKAQQQNWNYHSSKNSHRMSNTHKPQQNWQSHSSDTGHGTSAPQYHSWNHHSTPHDPYHSPRPLQHLHYNWSHTTDGYDIRNYPENAPDDPQRSESYHNDPAKYSMPSGLTLRNPKPPDSSSWQQNIVDRLSQHLPKLPSLSSLRIPGLSSLASFSLPKWAFGEPGREPQDPGYPMANRGDYMHKFYHLVPENDPLDHLNNNRDRNAKPLYTYPPHQGHDHHDTLKNTRDNDNKHQAHQHNHHTANDRTDDRYTIQGLTDTTLQHTNDPQVNQHGSYGSYTQHTSRFPQYTRPDPRRPLQMPQRILKVPQHQKNEVTEQQHSPNRHSWTWEAHNTPTSQQPHKDTYSRRPSTYNWIDTGDSGNYDPSSTTHKDFYAPNTYSSHPQEVYGYTPSYGQPQHRPQHLQHPQHSQQAIVNTWYPDSYYQQDYNGAGLTTVLHDNILEPLSNLLSRPSPLSIIDSSSYQQSIIERLTGVDTSSTSSFVLPGGALVIGLALALFYFNFVWYPTPVVTAKISKMLSQSVFEGQERAIGEVYRVFRGLEAEYKHDPSIWSTACRTRVVCQVHQELPALWKVTQTYATLFKSSLALGPETDSDLSGYQEAARRGSEGEDCGEHYHECPINTALLKATLKRLLALLQPA